MLNRQNIELAKLAVEDNRSVSGILVESGRTVVTDGKFLIIVAAPEVKQGEFPDADGYRAVERFDPFILPKKPALEVLKVLPTAYAAKGSPVLSQVAVGKAPEGSDRKAVLYTTDLETHKVFQFKTPSVPYANWRAVVPKPEKATVRVGLNVEILAKVFAELKAMGIEKVVLRATDEESTMRFDGTVRETGQHVTVVLAPYRVVEDDPAPSYVEAERPAEEKTIVAPKAAQTELKPAGV